MLYLDIVIPVIFVGQNNKHDLQSMVETCSGLKTKSVLGLA